MKIIVAQPNSNFYLWQLEVQWKFFVRAGVEKEVIYLFSYDKFINPKAIKFSEDKNCYFYKDQRKDKSYAPSIVFYLIGKYFEKHNLTPFIGMDADCVMVNYLNTTIKENQVYLAHTTSDYLSSTYIRSKGDDLFVRMCLEMDIDPNLVMNNDSKVGGAQYIFGPLLPSSFWFDVEEKSVRLFKLMEATKHTYKDASGHPIQSWTAGMWVVMWELWKQKIETDINPQLSFSWPNTPIDKWKDYNFYHNAGVTANTRGLMFYKGDYMEKSPRIELSKYIKNVCSFNYAKEVAALWL